MKADIAAEVDAMNGAAGEFDESRDGLAHDGSVEMTDVEDLERVRIGEFRDDIFAFIFVA